jgi:hypothetical protein
METQRIALSEGEWDRLQVLREQQQPAHLKIKRHAAPSL